MKETPLGMNRRTALKWGLLGLETIALGKSNRLFFWKSL